MTALDHLAQSFYEVLVGAGFNANMARSVVDDMKRKAIDAAEKPAPTKT